VTRRILSAADDLGLTEEGRSDYRRRVRLLFDEGCVMLGPEQASKLFREQARSQRKPGKGKRPPPPRERKGAHDPEGDRLLLQLWKSGRNGMSKRDFARMALKNHAVKIGGKVRPQDKPAQIDIAVNSLVRRLNRAIQNDA
jgi:hypothetical protein